jgi:hypothetical protein
MKRPEELLARGIITGLFGAAAVAMWFFFIDFSDGHPFRTPAALGSALLFGITGVELVKITFGVVAAYTWCTWWPSLWRARFSCGLRNRSSGRRPWCS